MKAIDEYDIWDGERFYYKSPICGAASSVGSYLSNLNPRILELNQSYFNQLQLVVETYQRLYYLFTSLNKYSDTSKNNKLSDYQMFASRHELEFKDYSYLLIISIKTFLDLFVILVDIIINQEAREEHKLPSFFGFPRYNKKSQPVNKAFQILMNKESHPWISEINGIRNKLIHRGYQLKANFSHIKSDKLIVQAIRGNNFSDNKQFVDIGGLFDSFITEIPKIETQITDILIHEIDFINKEQVDERGYIFGDVIKNFVLADWNIKG